MRDGWANTSHISTYMVTLAATRCCESSEMFFAARGGRVRNAIWHWAQLVTYSKAMAMGRSGL